MTWIKSAYAEEFAVVAAWLSALLPWSVSLAYGSVQGGTLLEARFSVGLVRYLFGIQFEGDAEIPGFLVLSPWRAADLYQTAPGSLPYLVWLLGAAILALTVVFSLLLYRYDDRLAASPVDPVRVMGGLLLGAAAVLTVAWLLLQFGSPGVLPFARIPGAVPLIGGVVVGPSTGFPGLTAPVGVAFHWVFAYLLLTVDRVADPATDDNSPGPDAEAGT